MFNMHPLCMYLFYFLLQPDYGLISSHCNLWRNYHDIHDSWKSIESTIDFFGDNQEVISPFIGPGRWADPDMVNRYND